MVKIICLVLLVYILFAIEHNQVQHGKTPTRYTSVIDSLHIACGIFLALFATVHGIGHIQHAKTISIVTGAIVLILLYAEVMIGIFLKSKRNAPKSVKKLHKVLPLAILCVIVAHIVSRGIV